MHHFIDGITETPISKQWKAPTITYDGVTDLNEFLSIYTNQISLYSTDNAILCKAFFTMLRCLTLEWFMSLTQFGGTI